MTQRAHPKLTQRHAQIIKQNESLLSQSDRELVENISVQVQQVQTKVIPLLTLQVELNKLKNKLSEKESAAYTKNAAVDEIADNLEEGTVAQCLESLFLNVDGNIISFDKPVLERDDLIDVLGLNENQLESLQNKERLNIILKDLKNEAQVDIENIPKEVEYIDNQLSQIEERIQTFKDNLDEIRNSFQNHFEVDNNFNLIKVPKSPNGPEFSVIFAKYNEVIHPIILYRGKKEYEGEVRQLGEGGFGQVKLGQHFYTHELLAIKKQSANALPEEVLAKEKAMLDKFGYLIATAYRESNYKDYIMQTLHYGKELEDLLKDEKIPNNEWLRIMAVSAEKLQALHDNNTIHRDIKLENFMWDWEFQEAKLIDLAFVVNVDGDNNIRLRDDAGSDGYKAPEVIQDGAYSKKSDIYAFGVMLEEVFKSNPFYELLKADIAKLKADNLDDRASNLNEIITKLSSEYQETLAQRKQSRAEPISTQFKQSKIEQDMVKKPLMTEIQKQKSLPSLK